MNCSFWLELFIRSGMLVAAGLTLGRISTVLGPGFRHKLLLFVFFLLATLPLFAMLLPSIPVPLWHLAHVRGTVSVEETILDTGPARSLPPRVNWLLMFWLTGVAVSLAPMVAGTLSVRRITRNSVPLRDPAWTNLLHELSSALVFQRVLQREPEIATARGLHVPLALGVLRPRILLPDNCGEWDNVRRRAVLLHELAHIGRRDLAAQLCVHIIAALWWFQPLVWVLRRSLRSESELACDAEALRFGLRPSQYAAELLEIAKEMSMGASWAAPVISMARPGDLERRLLAILQPRSPLLSRTRSVATITTLAIAAAAASALTAGSQQNLSERGGSTMKRTLISGSLMSAALSAATISGSIFDPSGAAIPDAKVLLYNPDTGAKQEATSGSDGKFILDDAPAGECILRVEKAGFSSVFREFNLKPDTKIERGLTMGSDPAQAAELNGKRVAVPEPLESDGTTRLRVGGEAAESNLVSKPNPVYPEAAKRAGIQGTVTLETVISAEGVPLEIRVLSSPSDDLTQSALEGVRQWRYKPMLLNGKPVEVVTVVVVNYTLAQ